MTSVFFTWRPWRRRTLVDVLQKNLDTPDPVPTPPVDLMQILMGQPG